MLRMDKNRSNPLESNPDIGVGTPLRQGVLQQTDVEPSGFFPEQEADQPIENYGVIGDLHTVALIGMDGSIDWCCFPRFDSPSVFGAILDRQKGGHFKIAPIGQFNRKQLYKTDTNILITRFLHEDGVGEVTDFMPMDRRRNGKEELKVHQIVRQVKVVRGTLKFRLECVPAFDYARKPHTLQLESEGAVFESDGLVLGLSSSFPLKEFRSGVACDFILKAGETCCFILKEVEGNDRTCVFKNKEDPKELIDRTQGYWKNWLSQCQYSGRWREMVQRSALTLKMLTYEPTGAILAGPTTSLPGEIGGERNFDYRFTWIRDASFILYALLRLGFTDEADGFMSWLEARCGELNPDGSLQVMYGINGEHDLHEQELTHLSGWKKSLPIRLGNAAFNQFQLDIYGELMDSVDLFYNKHKKPISYDLWVNLRRLVDWVCDHWQEKDASIWEVRGGHKHFVYSKVMCWIALDRGLKMATKRSLPADVPRWREIRDTIYEEVMEKGWNPKLKSFVQYYGSDTVDASLLIMPLVKFISPTDPRMLSTIDLIQDTLVSDSLVYRYKMDEAASDGLEGGEGTFSLCTFWLVEALTLAGRLEEAQATFEKMLTYANHLGLYAEEIGLHGEQLGNFPQGFTHLGLISAAYKLNRALGKSP